MFNSKMVLIIFLTCTFSLVFAEELDSGVDQMQVHPLNETVSLTSRLKVEYDKPRVVIRSYLPLLESNEEEVSPNISLFNQLVNEIYRQEIEHFKAGIDDFRKHNTQVKQYKNDLMIDNNTSIIKADEDLIISIRFNIEGNIAGDKRPFHYYRVLNYDLDTAEKIELNELFQPDANYLNVLSILSANHLFNKLNNKFWVKKGTEPILENFSHWNLKRNGILITFVSNQVAPQMLGTQTVLIPYPELADILSPISPLSTCIKKKRCVKSKLVTGGFIDEI